jgi:hypothetical protein
LLEGVNSRPPRDEFTTVAARRGGKSSVGTGTAAALTNGSAARAGEYVVVGVFVIRPGTAASAPGVGGDSEPLLMFRDFIREIAAVEFATRRHPKFPRIPTTSNPIQQWGDSNVKACVTTLRVL